MMEQGTAPREGLLDDWMHRAAGDVAGLQVIDVGCGEGRFSRQLANRGAIVTGVDLCEPFIEYAQSNRVGNETYLVGDGQTLSDHPDHSFDLAVSYLSLIDMPDLSRALKAIHRVLKPQGRFVLCLVHPMASAAGHWLKDEQGNKIHYVLDHYFSLEERPVQVGSGLSVTNYHRPLSDYFRLLHEANFVVEALHEPLPTPEQLAEWPSNADNKRAPCFLILELRAQA